MIVEQSFKGRPGRASRTGTASAHPGDRALFTPNPRLKLSAQVHEVMRFFHYSPRTEETYWHWIERFLRFCREEGAGMSREGAKVAKGELPIENWKLKIENRKEKPDGVEREAALSVSGPPSPPAPLPKERGAGWRHPRELGAAEVAAFLSHLATVGKVAAATQNQALNSLVFLYEQVLHRPLGDLAEVARVTRPARLPEVLGREAVTRLLDAVEADYQLPVRLLYGSGLRLLEGLRVRVRVKGFASRGFGF